VVDGLAGGDEQRALGHVVKLEECLRRREVRPEQARTTLRSSGAAAMSCASASLGSMSTVRPVETSATTRRQTS
jgi:hypothetical protein